MGKGQKHRKSPASHQHRTNQQHTASFASSSGGGSSGELLTNNELKNLFDDAVEENPYEFTWKDFGQGLLSILLCALLSVMVGVAAGITISIQYLDANDAMLVGTEGGVLGETKQTNAPQVLFHHPRTTIFDPVIASHNPLASGSDPIIIDGSRVSTADRTMLLVEESPLLGEEVGNGTNSAEKGSAHHLPSVDPPVSSFEQYSKIQPILCSDGKTYGYDTWDSLIDAFEEANSYSADRFMRWNKYFAATKSTFDGKFDDPMHYYEEDIVIHVCPNAVIRGKRGPIAFVNAENIALECEGCSIEIRQGSHFSFGPHAKNIQFRGVSFKGATTTSLLFHYDGAEVSLVDCFFHENSGLSKQLGTVADVNSTSMVNFYRCLMKNGPGDRVSGLTSLSIRSRDAEL